MKKIITLLILTLSTFTFSETFYHTPHGSKYHRASCRYGVDYKNSNPISLERAISIGLEPCKLCDPPGEVTTSSSSESYNNLSYDNENTSFTTTSIKDKDTIASFNVLHLGWNNSKNYNMLANVVSQFDLIGLMEVMKEDGLVNLVNALNSNSNDSWSYHISNDKVGRSSYKEYYGFIYNDEVEFLGSNDFYPDTYDDFERDPYASSFRFGKFDFTMVLLHSIYGDSKSEREDEADNLDDVYTYYQDLDPNENDIIIGGDFNLSARNSSFDLIGVDGLKYAIQPYAKTTIGYTGLSSAYDNIFYSDYSTEVIGSGVYDFTNNNYKAIRKIISDHLPVYLDVTTIRDDD